MSTSSGLQNLAPKTANASVADAGSAEGTKQNTWAGETVHAVGSRGVPPKNWRAAAHPARPTRTAGSAHDCDAVVVGGGPAGAAAAARLAARGFMTILVDRATFPRDKVCGDFVGPAALADLADLGVTGTEAFGATNTIGDCALYVDGDQLGALAIPQVDGLPAYGRVIPRRRLDAWVLDAARHAGATVLDGRKATAVQQASGAVTIHGHSAAGPWQLRTRLLIGADGSNSIIARALRGRPPPRQDRIVAVRAYFDDVAGPADRADICLCSDSFPGYSWLFPCGGGQANVGVGMVVSTYPQTGRNLRELLLRLIAEDPSMRHRLGGARIRGKILGCPLTTYNPRLPLVGDRIMLLGDAAGLINPLNGEGIQYALHSARWAADVAADRLWSGRLDAASLAGYEQRVHRSLRQDMAFSRLIVQLIRNRALNSFWLQALRIIAARASIDPDYAYRAGCAVTGLAPASRALGLSVAARTAGQAMISPRTDASTHHPGRRSQHEHPAPGPSPRKIGRTTRRALTPREFTGWAAGVGRALTELIFQLTRAPSVPAAITRGIGPGLYQRAAWTRACMIIVTRWAVQRSPAGDSPEPRKDSA
jgi:geranylgeranyl reductase family protein